MLTPEQLEAAARKLCEIRGIDADLKHAFTEADVDGSGALHLTERTVAEWECKADEIRAYLEIQEAVQSIPQPSPRIALRVEGWPLVRPWVWFKDYEGPKEGAEFQCTKCGERGRHDQLWLSEKKTHTDGSILQDVRCPYCHAGWTLLQLRAPRI